MAGRLLIANIFIIAGYKKIGGFAGTAGYMASKMGLPQDSARGQRDAGRDHCHRTRRRRAAADWLAGALGGNRDPALMIPVTLMFHAYWGLPADQMQMQMIQFQKNLAIMGGLLYIIACGPGAFSLGRDKC